MADLLKLYGTSEEPAPVRRLRAGPLSADLVGGALRTIRFAGHETIRAIAYVVRDRDWGTYDPRIENLRIEEAAEGFSVTYDAYVEALDGAILSYVAEIEGRADGFVHFAVEAVPDGAFETNRCGFCVLHPIEGVAGTPARVVHTDGSVEDAAFPDLIAPWQPFKDLREIGHEAAPGLRITCRMEGDAFEMEDQRAWSDASYKTYVRPLALPWPYRMEPGATNRQSVTLAVEGDAARKASSALADESPVVVRFGDALPYPMPRFGVAIAPEEAEATLAGIDRLGELAPQLLLFHHDPLAGHGEASLRAFATIAAHLPEAEHALELVLPGRDDPRREMREAASLIATMGFRPQTLVVGPAVDRQSTPPGSRWPDCPPLGEIYAAAREAFPGVAIGGGMFSYFTELNRKRVPLEPIDFVTHATCPIVHAADDLSVMQTLEALPFITRSTRAFIGEKPYRLGPTTIGMRQNPYGSRTMPNPSAKRVAMAGDDPRGRALFGAAWLVGYAARLADAGIEAWTGASFAGPRGVLLPDGHVAPAFHVAKGFAALAGCPRLELASDRRGTVDGFAALGVDGAPVIWLANLTAETRVARIEAGVDGWRVSRLDETSFDRIRAGDRPDARIEEASIALPPFAVARFEPAG